MNRPQLIATTWVVLWLLTTAFLFHVLATAWPYVNLHPQLLLLVTGPGLVFRAGDLAHLSWAGRQVTGWRRWLARAAALVVGFVLAGALSTVADRFSFERFQAAFAPLVAQLHANPASPCTPESAAATAVGFEAYRDSWSAPRASAQVRHDRGRFVLSLPGRSIDIDGSTVWYDSASRQWAKFHNDAGHARIAFEASQGLMPECKLVPR